MGHNNHFQFKQFLIKQEKSAMRVGTDGVLLGTWANVSNAKNILDIGTGTGLIALMIAQRSDAQITGVEIEFNAAEEARENVQNSPWKEQITIINQDFQEYSNQTKKQFDVIVTNPPFFSNAIKNQHTQKSIARHNHSLPFTDLIKGVSKLLTSEGKFSLILPVNEAVYFTNLARNSGLFLSKLLEIKPSPRKEPNRHLMEFAKEKLDTSIETLSIHEEDGKSYTEAYKKLTTDFYLNF